MPNCSQTSVPLSAPNIHSRLCFARNLACFSGVSFEIPTSPHHKPFFDLYEDTLKLQSEGQDVTQHRVELFQKTAYPFQIFIWF